MTTIRGSLGPSSRPWRLAIALAGVLASGLPEARGGCPAIAAGDHHSLALSSDGTVQAWGSNLAGQLGNGTTVDSSLPVRVADPSGTGLLSDVTAIAGGAWYSLALKNDGTVWAWGANGMGQLGTGMACPSEPCVGSSLPVQVLDASGSGFLTGVIAIAAGPYHSLALKGDGSVWAWGSNLAGELGNGTACNPGPCGLSLPVQVLDASGTGFLSGVTAISAGEWHSLALKGDGTVWAWGSNGMGQLGNGTKTESHRPVPVKDPTGTGSLTGVIGVAGGGVHSLALTGDGSVWAWGDSLYGQLGNGTTCSPGPCGLSLPVPVADPTGAGFLSGVTAIAGGEYHSLAITADGSAWAWGYNGNGALGNGTTTASSLPVQVEDSSGSAFLAGVSAISAGFKHSLATTGGASVWAWGDNLYGELGDGTNTDASLPVRLSMLLGPSLPPDQGNVLRAIKSGTDVVLTWTGTGAVSWGVYRDPAKRRLGLTQIPPAVGVVSFVDAGRVVVAADDFYRVKGLTPCGAGL